MSESATIDVGLLRDLVCEAAEAYANARLCDRYSPALVEAEYGELVAAVNRWVQARDLCRMSRAPG